MANVMEENQRNRRDFSEWLAGPRLIALSGNDTPDEEFRLGTREYDWHQHARGQVFCVETGLIHVQTMQGSWVLPPQRAGWIPPTTVHQVHVCGALTGWSLLIAPDSCVDLPSEPCVIGTSEVLRALVKRAVAWEKHSVLMPEQERMVSVMLDEIRRAPGEPLYLPMPRHPRLARILHALLESPGSDRSLEAWAKWGAVSPRSLRRLIMTDTGLSFAQWRQQARLAYALARLADGEAVTQVAEALGYAAPSNFIAMFRRAFGESPARYFAVRR